MGREPHSPRRTLRERKKNESGQAQAVTPQTVEALLAYAVGVMRMGFRDFCALTPGELTLAAAQFAEERTRAHQGEWERTRTLAAITVQPHVKGRVSARSLLPLPWDKEAANPNRPAAPTLSKEQSLERLKGLLARQGAESQRPTVEAAPVHG